MRDVGNQEGFCGQVKRGQILRFPGGLNFEVQFMVEEYLSWGPIAESFSGPVVELIFNRFEMGRFDFVEVMGAWKVLAQQPIEVLVTATLPGRPRIGEVHVGL